MAGARWAAMGKHMPLWRFGEQSSFFLSTKVVSFQESRRGRQGRARHTRSLWQGLCQDLLNGRREAPAGPTSSTSQTPKDSWSPWEVAAPGGHGHVPRSHPASTTDANHRLDLSVSLLSWCRPRDRVHISAGAPSKASD